MYYVNDGPHADRGGPGFRETLSWALAAVDDGTLYVETGARSAAAETDYQRLYDAVLDGDATVVRPGERDDPATAVDPGTHAARVVDRAPDAGLLFDVPGVDSTDDLLDRVSGVDSVETLRSSLAEAEGLTELRGVLDDHDVDGALREALDPDLAWPDDEPAVVEDGAVVFADGLVDVPTGADRAQFVKMELVEDHADSLATVAVEPAGDGRSAEDEGGLASSLSALDPGGAFAALSNVVGRDERFADRIRADVDAGDTDPDDAVVVMGRSHTLARRLRDRGFDPTVDPGRAETMSRLRRAIWWLNDRVGSATVEALGAARRLLTARSSGAGGRSPAGDGGRAVADDDRGAGEDDGEVLDTVGPPVEDGEPVGHDGDDREASEWTGSDRR